MKEVFIRKHRITIILFIILFVLSISSLFVGVLEVNIQQLWNGDSEAWNIFLVSRVPRLLAVLCTGAGMSVAGLLMQQLCMNKFVGTMILLLCVYLWQRYEKN